MKKIMIIGLFVLLSCNKQEEAPKNGPIKGGDEIADAKVLDKAELEIIDSICDALALQRSRLENGSDMNRRFLVTLDKKDCSGNTSKSSDTIQVDVPFDSEKAAFKSISGQQIITNLVTDRYYMVNLYCETGETSNQWESGTTKYALRVLSKDQIEVIQYKKVDSKWLAKRVESIKVLLNGRERDKGVVLVHEQGLFCNSGSGISYTRQSIK
ncbi:putative lipoprotein [Bacteriovorax sp. BSW11_IV]|uniref:hypothetical protein n=1 Tax=Bacteriovorax sp. BSW11_IV TaxID=1353529 RepID=UPI00038A02BC|nr:hypothetical protein [Bacteriovorax sp. BSW11_IV]EQC48893.1 putative lipoprotein [Bacteriovorax sp. BSW11_IV]